MTDLDKGRKAVMRHASWLKRNGYSACGGQAFAKEGVTLTVLDDGKWYCRMHLNGKFSYGDGRTPWSAENSAASRLN